MCSPTWALSDRSVDRSASRFIGSVQKRAGLAAVAIVTLVASVVATGCEVDSDERAVLGRGPDEYVDGREPRQSEPSPTGARRPRGTAGASAGRSGGSGGAAAGDGGRAAPAPDAAGEGGSQASAGRDGGAGSNAAEAGPDDAGPAVPDAESGDVQDVPPAEPSDEDPEAAEGGDDDGETGDDEAGGDERDGARNQGQGSANAFFDALLTLIESVLLLDPVEASSQLFALLSAATGLDPEALGGLILWIDEADLCRDDPTLCEVACGLLEGRCSACAEQETCREAVKRVCVDRIDACY